MKEAEEKTGLPRTSLYKLTKGIEPKIGRHKKIWDSFLLSNGITPQKYIFPDEALKNKSECQKGKTYSEQQKKQISEKLKYHWSKNKHPRKGMTPWNKKLSAESIPADRK